MTNRAELLDKMADSYGRFLTAKSRKTLLDLTRDIPDWLFPDAVAYAIKTKAEFKPPSVKMIFDAAIELSRPSASDYPDWYVAIRKNARARAKRRRDGVRDGADNPRVDQRPLDDSGASPQRAAPERHDPTEILETLGDRISKPR